MAHGVFQRLSGRKGDIQLVGIGALIGTIAEWSLTRRGDDGPDSGLYDLRAALSYVNEGLLNDSDYTKKIVLPMQGKNYSIKIDGDTAISVNGKRLLVQGVRLSYDNED